MRAVRTVLDSGRPIAQVAKDLDVGSESLRTWVRQARTDAGGHPGGPTSEQLEELRRLRSENRELRKCQRPSVSPQLRPSVLPSGGHVVSPLVAIGSPQRAVVAELRP